MGKVTSIRGNASTVTLINKVNSSVPAGFKYIGKINCSSLNATTLPMPFSTLAEIKLVVSSVGSAQVHISCLSNTTQTTVDEIYYNGSVLATTTNPVYCNFIYSWGVSSDTQQTHIATTMPAGNRIRYMIVSLVGASDGVSEVLELMSCGINATEVAVYGRRI